MVGLPLILIHALEPVAPNQKAIFAYGANAAGDKVSMSNLVNSDGGCRMTGVGTARNVQLEQIMVVIKLYLLLVMTGVY